MHNIDHCYIDCRKVCLGLLREADNFYNKKGGFISKSVKPVPVRGILFLKKETPDGFIGVDLVNKDITYPIGPNDKCNTAFVISRSYVNLEPLLSYWGMANNLSDDDILRAQKFLLSREFFQKNEALFGRKSFYLGVFGYFKYGHCTKTKLFPLAIGDMIAGVHSLPPKRRTLTLTSDEKKYWSSR